jgi:signal transduction histidine kinase
MRTLRAEAVHFVLHDYQTQETFIWHVDRATTSKPTDLPRVQLSPEEYAAWCFVDPGRVWEGIRDRAGTTLRVRAVEPGVWPVRRDRTELPPLVHSCLDFDRIVVANLGLPDEWRGRLYVIDPAPAGSIEQLLHFVEALVEHVTPALSNVFLLGRLRARVTAAERARVARELHDGAIQALFGVEMKVEALRRRAEALPPEVLSELTDVQTLLRIEVLALRELMQALRPIDLDTSDQLPDVLATVVERFRRDSGVPARFVFTGRSINVPAATALEIVRIVQEALVNVRKHSRARNVLVRLSGAEGSCSLTIEDDGVGFAFEGAFTGEELDRRRVGPAIIKERARIAGARLSIESAPGGGARIEVTLPNPA